MRIALAALAMIATIGINGTAQAQSQTALEARVDRLEREMRAVQRKVFPGGAGATVEPEITTRVTEDPNGGSSSPVADLTQRVASLEAQLASLTDQLEQTQNRVRILEDAFSAYKRSTDARIKALEDNLTALRPAVGDLAENDTTVTETPATRPTRPATRPTTPPATTTTTTTPPANNTTATPPPAGDRATRLAAIERPKTSDPAEDAYVYGFRLWSAKLYPEARKALEEVVAKYPKHRRASFAQNLLGRSYLDAGAPSLAAKAFYDNYRNNPNGERAPDSLYYLAQALQRLNKPATEICKVYTELMQLYGDKISEEMKAGVAEGRARNKCK